MLVQDILKKVHRKFAKDTDYPEEGSEDLLVRIDHLNDGVAEWENKVKDGVYWTELVSETPFTLGGTGSDALPSDFLSFIRKNNEDDDASVIIVGNNVWTEVSPAEGMRSVASGLSPYIFWQEGKMLKTLPAATGDIPYLRKATRYATGVETTEPEMSDPSFLEDYTLSKVFLDNSDDTLYTVFANSAKEKLDAMAYEALARQE